MLLERLLEDLTRGQWLIPRSTAGLTIAEAHRVVAVLVAAKAYVEDDGGQTVNLYGDLEAAVEKLFGGKAREVLGDA